MDNLLSHVSSILVGLSLLAVLFVFGLLQIRQCREPEKPTQEHNQPPNDPPIHTNDKKTADENHRAAERAYWNADIKIKGRPNWLGRFTTGFSAVAAIAAVVGYIEIERQIGIAQTSADASTAATVQATQQTIILQEQLAQSRKSVRPYVVAEIGINQVASGPLSGDNGNSSYGYTARVHFTNFGTTPAIIKHIEGFVALALPSNELTLNKDYATDLILAQGVTTEEFPIPGHSNMAEAMNVIVGSGSLYVSGKITYVDIADQPMSTEFCYSWPIHSRDPRRQLVPAYGPGCYNKKT